MKTCLQADVVQCTNDDTKDKYCIIGLSLLLFIMIISIIIRGSGGSIGYNDV